MKIDKVYTKQGDKGSTRLSSKKTISKDNVIIELLGNLDELNSFLGLAKSSIINNIKFLDICNFLIIIQKNLFDIGSEISKICNPFQLPECM